MTEPFVVVVSGPPGSGKTTIAGTIAARVHLPLIAKDDIKESLFDSLGWSDVEWSRTVGKATWDLLFLLFERLVSGGASFVFESNFHVDHREVLLELRDRYGFRTVEVHCTADPKILEDRFYNRDRHPGHGDLRDIDFTQLNDAHPAVGLDVVIDVDTGDPEAIDVDAIVQQIRGMWP